MITERVNQERAVARPRLVFFRFRYDHNTPHFLLEHTNEHVRCLSQFFDLNIVATDCDFDEVCTRHQPDLVLFETGVEAQTAHRLRITSIGTHRNIPRLALMNSDGCTELRPAILSDIEHRGIEAAFTISAVAAEHIKSITVPLYTWPNFIDPATHRKRDLPRLIPFLISGSQSPRYPWRHEVFPLLAENYPAIICPHGGYSSRRLTSNMLVGEEYSKALNAAVFSPTCGSIAKDVVRKHLEIPANGSCLITEDSPALRSAGFEDMVNCVMASRRDVLEKVGYLLGNPDKLNDITARGFQLVQAQHTIRHRNQISEWFRLRIRCGAHMNIVQNGCFGSLEAVESNSRRATFPLQSQGQHLEILRRADVLLAGKNYTQAEALCRQILGFLSEFPEAKLRIAICQLHMGKPRLALSSIIQPLRCSLKRYGAENPDPVEWSYFLIVLLCLGRVASAGVRAFQFEGLRHPELDRVRQLVARITGDSPGARRNALAEIHAPSIHTLPLIHDEWSAEVASMLRVCGQAELASSVAGESPSDDLRNRHRRRNKYKVHPFAILSKSIRPNLSGLDNPELISRLIEKTRAGGKALLNSLPKTTKRSVDVSAPSRPK